MSKPRLPVTGDDAPLSPVSPTMDRLDKKLNQIYAWFDQNRDGWVTEDDVEKMTLMFTSLAADNDEKSKSLIREGFLNWWRLLLAGREDKTSERLGQEEFIHAMRAIVIAPDNFQTAIGSVVDGMLGALDRDGNGVLSQDEYLAMYQGLSVSRAAGIEAFKRLDRDGNGEISHSELQQAIFEFYLSPDPLSPGNWLLGPPEELQ